MLLELIGVKTICAHYSQFLIDSANNPHNAFLLLSFDDDRFCLLTLRLVRFPCSTSKQLHEELNQQVLFDVCHMELFGLLATAECNGMHELVYPIFTLTKKKYDGSCFLYRPLFLLSKVLSFYLMFSIQIQAKTYEFSSTWGTNWQHVSLHQNRFCNIHTQISLLTYVFSTKKESILSVQVFA